MIAGKIRWTSFIGGHHPKAGKLRMGFFNGRSTSKVLVDLGEPAVQ